MSKELFPSEIQDVPIKSEELEEEDKKSTNTPNAKKAVLNGPRTPTPFKNALNEIRKIHGQTYVPSSPNGLVEDITEIMNKERQQDSTMDSVYETDSSIAMQTHPDDSTIGTSNPKRLTYEEYDVNQQQKKAKKSLESTWNSTTDESEDFPYLVETPVGLKIFCFIYFFVFFLKIEKESNKNVAKMTCNCIVLAFLFLLTLLRNFLFSILPISYRK